MVYLYTGRIIIQNSLFIWHCSHIHKLSSVGFALFLDHPVFPPRGPLILWTPFLCCCRPWLVVKLALQFVQLKGLSPLCIRSWAMRLSFFLNVFAQMLHWNWGPWWDASCALTLFMSEYLFPQNLQSYFVLFECSICMCLLNWVSFLKVREHISHLKTRPSCST